MNKQKRIISFSVLLLSMSWLNPAISSYMQSSTGGVTGIAVKSEGGIGGPDLIFESFAVSYKDAGDPLSEPVSNIMLASNISEATRDPFTFSQDFAPLDSINNDLRIQQVLDSDVSGTNAHNLTESLKASSSGIPIPATIWLFGAALIGFVGLSRRTSI